MIRIRTGIQLSLVALGMLLFMGLPDLLHAQGRSQHSMRIHSPAPYTLGDTLEVSLDITIASGEAVIAASGYLTLDPDVFFPVLWPNGLPFKEGALFNNAADINGTHGDSLHLAHDANSYTDDSGRYYNGWGWQLSYFQQTPPESPRPAISGPLDPVSIATFRFVVEDLPPNDTIAIGYEYNDIFHRNSQYSILVSEGTSTEGPYANMPYTLQIPLSGVAIRPAMPDTIVVPGNGLDIYLGDYFSSNIMDSSTAEWALNILNLPLSGPSPWLVNQVGPSARLQLNTNPGDKYIIEANLQLSALDTSESPPITYYDDQDFTIIVDNLPVFIPPVDTTYTLDEDVPLKIRGKGGIFSDADDNGLDFTARLEPDNLVHVTYGADDSLVFYSDTNAYGDQVARLYIEDALGLSIDTVLYFTVNPINDPPVVNFDSASALGDTLVIHRATPKTVDLSLCVSDVDDPVLDWSVNNPDTANLAATPLPGDRLRLLAADDAAYVDIDLVLTATDDEGASDSDTLVVSIRSWPPDIIVVEDIKINSQGTPPAKGLDLTQWVTDLDMPLDQMTWSFRAVDAGTYANDDSVTFSPTSGSVTDTVTISVPSNYSAIDILEMTVTDDDANTDIDTTRLFIFDGDAPMIFPLPGLTVYRDSTHAGILNLDDYVADIQDDPVAISWTYTGGDSLESFYIDPSSHEVTISTNTTFIGNLIVSLVTTNSRGLGDTSDLAILVSRIDDGPPIWYTKGYEEVVVYGDTTDLFTYGQVCFDETPTDSIFFTSYCDTTLLTVTIASPDSVKLTTPILVKDSTTYLYFTAKDELGNVSSSDTITIRVKDSFSPVWDPIPTIYLDVGGTFSGLFLWNYVSDRDTEDSLLTIEVVNLNPSLITMSYNSATTELTVQAGLDKGDRWLSLTATDDKGNTASTLAHVVVRAVADYTPPDGGLTYFLNPATDRWIHYVVTADSSTDISRFTWHYAYGSPPRDWSDHLSFVMQDSLPGTVTWIAPYHFQEEGSYALTVEIIDAANNMLEISPVSLSVGFSKAIGGVLASPDQQLTVSYSPAPIPNGKLLIISEDTLPDSTGQPTAKIAKARANEEAASLMPATVYALDTNLPEPILVTLTYHQKRDTDPYYSFYELDGDQLVKIETYTSTDGHFEAAATLGRDVIFASSDTPARNAPLPGAELLCYPNPFNATIQVRFLLRWPDRGRIVIYDLLGREVYASPRQILEAGVHAFSWHSIDSWGLPAPSGLYFIRLETDGGKLVTRKVTLLK